LLGERSSSPILHKFNEPEIRVQAFTMAFKRLAVGGPLLTSQAKIPLGNESGNSLSDACPWQWCAKTNQCRRVVGTAQGYTQGLEDSNCSARRPETGHPNPADSLMRTAGRVRHSRIYARWAPAYCNPLQAFQESRTCHGISQPF
jgi:hypothetical protein